jgi:hypothetical protein
LAPIARVPRDLADASELRVMARAKAEIDLSIFDLYERRRLVAMDYAFIAALKHELLVEKTETARGCLGRLSPAEKFRIRCPAGLPQPADVWFGQEIGRAILRSATTC